MLCSKNVCITFKKKGLHQALFSFWDIGSVYIFKHNYFYCGLKFMLVDVGINSEHIGINIIDGKQCHAISFTVRMGSVYVQKHVAVVAGLELEAKSMLPALTSDIAHGIFMASCPIFQPLVRSARTVA